MTDSAGTRGPRRGGPWHGFAKAAVVLSLVAGGAGWIHAQAPGAAPLPGHVLWGVASVFLGLLLCSGLVSSSETALFSLDKLDLSQLRKSRRWNDRSILRLLDQPNDSLITILILNNFFNIAISLVAGGLMGRLLHGAGALAFTLAAALASTSILLFGEILPKILAHLNPLRTSRVLAPPLVLVTTLLRPVRVSINLLVRGLFAALRLPEQPSGDEVTEEELKVMISSGEVAQVLEADEREMIDGVFDLRHTVAAEIMTPRMSVDALPDDLTQADMIARLKSMPHNRMPVYHDNLDQLRGFLLAKEVLLDEAGDWRTHLREVLCVPEGVGLLDLLRTFRVQRTKMAVIIDEYGGVAGIVTLQDLLEEIVGDIYEKHEHFEQEVIPLGESRWRVTGAAPLDRIGEALGSSFPEHKGRTLGGFVMNTLGRIPMVGDEIVHEGYILTVEKMAGRRILSLRVTRPAAQTGPESEREAAP